MNLFDGKRLLVVGLAGFLDDDTRLALTRQGARILGPFVEANQAMDSLWGDDADGAILDITQNEHLCSLLVEALEDQ
jgi:hypothetical protein